MNRSVPPKNYDLPDTQHGEFWLMAQGVGDYVVPAFPIDAPDHGIMLTIAATEEAIYVTRAQAMAFFGLTANPVPNPAQLRSMAR